MVNKLNIVSWRGFLFWLSSSALFTIAVKESKESGFGVYLLILGLYWITYFNATWGD